MPVEITPQPNETQSSTDANIKVDTAHHKPTMESDAQTIFDDRWQLFMNPFGELCQKEEVPIAIAIVVDPKVPQQPLILMRGGEYEAAKLLARVLRQLQQKIAQEIAT